MPIKINAHFFSSNMIFWASSFDQATVVLINDHFIGIIYGNTVLIYGCN